MAIKGLQHVGICVGVLVHGNRAVPCTSGLFTRSRALSGEKVAASWIARLLLATWFSLNSLKRGYIGDYIGDYFRG